MKNRRLLLLIVALNLCIIVLAVVTFAWFVEVKRTNTIIFRAGEVDYRFENTEIQDAFIDNSLVIVPGQELLKEDGLIISNHSTIMTQVRLRIIIRYTLHDLVTNEESDGICELTDANNLALIGEMNEVFEEGIKKYGWVYQTDEDQGHWYYQIFEDDVGTNNIFLVPEDKNNGERIGVLTSLKLNGNVLGNMVEAENVVVTIYVQGKQANYVDWESLGYINIGT